MTTNRKFFPHVLLNGATCFVTRLTPLISLLPGESPAQAIAGPSVWSIGQNYYYPPMGKSPEEKRLISFLRALQFAGNCLMAFTISSTIFPQEAAQRGLKTPIRVPGCLGSNPGLQFDFGHVTDRATYLMVWAEG